MRRPEGCTSDLDGGFGTFADRSIQCPPSKRRACSSKDGLSLPSRWLRHPLPNQEDAMTKTPFIWAAILTASLGAPALAQMGGSMMGGGSGGDSRSPVHRGKMSSGAQQKGRQEERS